MVSYDALINVIGYYSKRDRHRYKEWVEKRTTWIEVYIESTGTSMTELFCKNS